MDQQRSTATNKQRRSNRGKGGLQHYCCILTVLKGLYTPIYTPMPIVAVGLSGSHKKKKEVIRTYRLMPLASCGITLQRSSKS